MGRVEEQTQISLDVWAVAASIMVVLKQQLVIVAQSDKDCGQLSGGISSGACSSNLAKIRRAEGISGSKGQG